MNIIYLILGYVDIYVKKEYTVALLLALSTIPIVEAVKLFTSKK